MRWFRRRRLAPEDRSATARLRSALHLVLAGDLPAAEAALAAAAKEDTDSPDVYLALANLYRARGEVGRAIQIHQNLLLRTDLGDAPRREALLGLALDFRNGGFLKRAAASFEEVLEIEPRNESALRALEELRIDTGEWDGAIEVRKRIGSRDPATPKILAHLWTGLGRAHVEAGDEGEARKAFRRALRQDKSCADAYLALGDQCEREAKPKKAIGAWRRAIGLHPAIGIDVYPRLHRAYRALGDLPGFGQVLHRQLEATPTDHEASLWLARTLLADQQVDEALASLHRILDRAPDYLPAHHELGRVLIAEKRDFEAVKALEELLERLPSGRPKLQCHSCGTQDDRIHWRCPQCGTWDGFA